MPDLDIPGPIDFVLIEFPGDRITGAAATALMDLVDRGIVRLYDLLVIDKSSDGTFSTPELSELSETLGGFSEFIGARSGLLSNDDVGQAAAIMEPGTMAALIVYENTWAIPFVAAALDAGGQLVASARIPATDVIDVLDALESTN